MPNGETERHRLSTAELSRAIGMLQCGTSQRVLAVIAVPLTNHHKADRLQWAREHVRWSCQAWNTVLFMDESKFGSGSN